MLVTKRDGRTEQINIEKIHKVCTWATEGITNVSISELELKAQLQFYPNIKTSDIQETLIKSAADLISEETPNYQWVAGRLVNYHLRKEIYNAVKPPKLLDQVTKLVNLKMYTPELLEWYTPEEFAEMDSVIDHNRDFNITYAGMEQFRGKYLVQNRVTKKLYETPQMAFALIAMTLFHAYKKDRMTWVKEYYDAVSNFEISLPTPVMAGLRTPQKQFSSCVLVDTDDSLDSINASASAIVKYVSQKAGIGLNVGKIRAIGSPVRSGDTSHTGIVPFIKYFQAAVKSCSQGSVRGGAATVNIPIWHLEIEDVLVLKNNKGTENTRARQLDYVIQFNKLFYERLLSGGNITLFSPSDCGALYDAFFHDNEVFKDLYEALEANPSIRKKTLKAIDLFSLFIQERKDTGRVYLMNVDHANEHSSFNHSWVPAIKMTNLCCEITLPTIPMKNVSDPEGEVALCTLSAINWGKIKEPKDFQRPCTLAVRGLDALLSYQDYMVPAARNSTMKYRPLGVGIINLAYWMAKNGMTYSEPNLELIDEYAEAWSYYLIKASNELQFDQEIKGGGVPLTKYAQGILPVDTYKKDVDQLVPHNPKMPWDTLRQSLIGFGIRNATLMALMPSETSSIISNSTNGIEPVRSLITVKQSKDGVLKQVVPEFRKLKNKYELLWDIKSPEGYLKICAVLQKYIDQAISVNTSYNPKFYPDGQLPMSELMKDIVNFYKYGGKNLYYFNLQDGAGEIEIEDTKAEEPDDENCDSCVI